MKKYMIYVLVCLMALLAGCQKAAPAPDTSAASGTQVSYAAWLHDQGYQPAEGWMYEMELSDAAQVKELDGLLNGASFRVLDQIFEYGKGYHLVFHDADGSVKRELLILEDGQASMNGMLYETANAEPLLQWLDALKLDEQEME